MSRRIGDDERSSIRGKKAIRHIDRNTLLTLGLKTVDQQREVQLAALGAVAFGIAFERAQVILENPFGVEQQAPDQGRLAVVDAATCQEAELRKVQKYPCCFLRSIDPG